MLVHQRVDNHSNIMAMGIKLMGIMDGITYCKKNMGIS
jgi:hypothetical protein